MTDAGPAAMVIPVHRLTPYLRVRISTDDRSIAISHRRSLIGLVPLWAHRIEIPLTDLASGQVTRNIRWLCVAAAVVLAVGIFLLNLPLILVVGLTILGLLELLLAFAPGRAIRLERTDGRSWRIAFCRAHGFDASLALEDAEQRSDALLATPDPGPGAVAWRSTRPRVGGSA